MTRDLLWELRVVQRLSAHRIGDMLGYSEIQVRSGLKRHGIFQAGYNSSLPDELGAGELWWLHHHEGLSVKAIAKKLRASPQKVADRMEELAITQRDHGRMPRPDDLPPGMPAPDLNLLEAVLQKAALKPPSVQQVGLIDDASDEELRRLHLEQGKGLTEIGRLYRSTPETVRRRFERADIEIRHRRGRRGMGPLTTKSYEKLMSLYSRADVKEALGRLA